MKYIHIFLFIVVLFMYGCGNNSKPYARSLYTGASGGSSDIVDPIESNKLSKVVSSYLEPLHQEQWALLYDKPFYDAYNINKDAHVHLGEYIEKYRGKHVKIAIIDEGFDIEHYEYKKNIVAYFNSRDGSHNIDTNETHGTEVAGVIASNENKKGIRGFAPDVELIFIHLELSGFLDTEDFLKAFEIAEKENVDIINCSWGTGDVSEVVKAKIVELATKGRDGKGINIIFASGNTNEESSRDESSLDEVIGVGASDEENLRAVYSNFGKGLDVLAPGGYELGISTTGKDDTIVEAEAVEYFAGTSASAPIVSSLIALMLEADPSLTRTKIHSILSLGVDKVGNVPYLSGRNPYYGYGKVNFEKTLQIVEKLR
jgi:subtilisin family serine protease